MVLEVKEAMDNTNILKEKSNHGNGKASNLELQVFFINPICDSLCQRNRCRTYLHFIFFFNQLNDIHSKLKSWF